MNFTIGEIYNRLFDFESKTKNKKGENQLYPIHKKLQFKDEKYNDISDWIINHLKINKGDFILDAGCGVGYVLTRICSHLDCTGLGVSLSEKEIAYAENISKGMKFEREVFFEQKSFDEKFDVYFDVIIAIESIKHSDSIQKTIENLVDHLKPGGRIFILDDYITHNRFQLLKKQVKKYWAVNSFYPLKLITEKLIELKLSVEIVDFTSKVTYTNKRLTGAKLFFIYPFLFLAKLLPFIKIYTIYFAGFCLERLYQKGALEYKAIIATNSI